LNKIPKYNVIIVETDAKIEILSTHIYEHSLSWPGTGIYIKRNRVELVSWMQSSSLDEMV
jgi:hypothetical protein